jgi:hypothetical protein
LVVVTATGGDAAQNAANRQAASGYAESVLVSLGEMGLPVERIRLSGITSSEISNNEIRLFVR